MKQVRWGFIGLGNIASKFAEGFQYTKNAKLLAISSRSENKLNTFKNKFQIGDNYCFANYDNLLECKDLDIVYIALPHSFHFPWIMKCLENNKKVHFYMPFFYCLLKTIFPFTTVITISVLRISLKGIVIISSEKIVKSANLPTSIEPFISS